MTNPMTEREEPVVHDPDLLHDEYQIEASVLRDDILDKPTFDAVMVMAIAKQITPYSALRLLVRRGYRLDCLIRELEQ